MATAQFATFKKGAYVLSSDAAIPVREFCRASAMSMPLLPPSISLGRYWLHLRFPQGLALAEFPGFVFHGVLGAALQQISPTAYSFLFGDCDIVRPWMLADLCSNVAPGACGVVELRLFNGASRHLPEIAGAFMLAGAGGLGADRSPFVLERIEALLPRGATPCPLDFKECAVVDEHTLDSWCSNHAIAGSGLGIAFLTPAILKEGNAIVQTPPSFRLLMARIFSRLSLLANEKAIDPESKARWLAMAEQVEIIEANAHWQRQSRYSGRQKQSMPFGGLIGDIRYSAPAARFAPWLEAASMIGVGGKTTFGLGQIAWSVEQNN